MRAGLEIYGITRFQQNYSVGEIAIADRLLRGVVVKCVAEVLGRRASVEEEIALHMSLDIMPQQAVVAYVEHQNRRLRQAAEAELEYLSFLSHDISNALGSLLLWLKVLSFSTLGMNHLAFRARWRHWTRPSPPSTVLWKAWAGCSRPSGYATDTPPGPPRPQ